MNITERTVVLRLNYGKIYYTHDLLRLGKQNVKYKVTV